MTDVDCLSLAGAGCSSRRNRFDEPPAVSAVMPSANALRIGPPLTGRIDRLDIKPADRGGAAETGFRRTIATFGPAETRPLSMN